MDVEIDIRGPSLAVLGLYQELGSSMAIAGSLFRDPADETCERLRVLFTDASAEGLDDKLSEISDAVRRMEGKFSCAQFEIRVRNIACSEPSSGADFFREPFKPISSLTILPWHSTLPELRHDTRTIIIDPHDAFGTGRHPTTRLCLEAIDVLYRELLRKPDFFAGEVLDFGCGTGLLTIAAVKMGARRGLGVEIEPESVKAARHNVELNGLSERIEIREGSFEVITENFDLILANLTPSVLGRTGRQVAAHLREEGRMVISGFSPQQIESTELLFADLGFKTLRTFVLEGWGALIMSKSLDIMADSYKKDLPSL